MILERGSALAMRSRSDPGPSFAVDETRAAAWVSLASASGLLKAKIQRARGMAMATAIAAIRCRRSHFLNRTPGLGAVAVTRWPLR